MPGGPDRRPGRPATAADVVVVGAGVQGLSCARVLAERLGPGRVQVLDRHGPGAGASGISGGIVRGYYRSPAMLELVCRSVPAFESHAEQTGYRQVGYMAVVPERQVDDLVAIHAAQSAAGYASELVIGRAEATSYLRWMWPDANCADVAAVLHERRSGFADAAATVRWLAARAREAGAVIQPGVDVVAVERTGGALSAVVTDRGDVRCRHVVVAPGPWAPQLARRLGLDVRFRLFKAREGDLVPRRGAGPSLGSGAGRAAPIVHLDQSRPLRDGVDGRQLHPGPWGIYFRLDARGVTGGVLPERLPDDVPIEPYGHANAAHVAGDDFTELFTAGLRWFLPRLAGPDAFRAHPHGGVVALSDDGMPIVGEVAPGLTLIADSGHAFKLLALGELAATELLDGAQSALVPFRPGRFAAGALHPTSTGPYPWT